jgi:hypothetical protein
MGDFQTIYFQETQAFWHKNLPTLLLNWLHNHMKVYFGKAQTTHGKAQQFKL